MRWSERHLFTIVYIISLSFLTSSSMVLRENRLWHVIMYFGPFINMDTWRDVSFRSMSIKGSDGPVLVFSIRSYSWKLATIEWWHWNIVWRRWQVDLSPWRHWEAIWSDRRAVDWLHNPSLGGNRRISSWSFISNAPSVDCQICLANWITWSFQSSLSMAIRCWLFFMHSLMTCVSAVESIICRHCVTFCWGCIKYLLWDVLVPKPESFPYEMIVGGNGLEMSGSARSESIVTIDSLSFSRFWIFEKLCYVCLCL